MKDAHLSSLLLPHAAHLTEQLADASVLEPVLHGLWKIAKETWPAVDVSAEGFLRRIAETLLDDPNAEPMKTLERLFAADLYLACGCAAGDAAAVATFDKAFIEPLPVGKLAWRGSPGDFHAELKQGLRERLLVGGIGVTPRIASYSGRGPLVAWVQVAAARAAVNLREAQRVRAGLPLQDHGPAAGDDLEVDFFRREYGSEFQAAFADALAHLPAKDSLMVRFYYLDGMTAEQIGRVLGASSRSVQRWIAQVRAQVLHKTREGLVTRCGLTASQLDVMMAMLHKDIDLTISRYLERQPHDAGLSDGRSPN